MADENPLLPLLLLLPLSLQNCFDLPYLHHHVTLLHCSTLCSFDSVFLPFSSWSYSSMKCTRIISRINNNTEMLWSWASNSLLFPTIKIFPLVSFTTKNPTVPNLLCILHQYWYWLWILSVTLIALFKENNKSRDLLFSWRKSHECNSKSTAIILPTLVAIGTLIIEI